MNERYTYLYLYIYKRIYTYTYTYMYIYINMYMCISIYTRICTYMYFSSLIYNIRYLFIFQNKFLIFQKIELFTFSKKKLKKVLTIIFKLRILKFFSENSKNETFEIFEGIAGKTSHKICYFMHILLKK